jgi:hypothetical protein
VPFFAMEVKLTQFWGFAHITGVGRIDAYTDPILSRFYPPFEICA